MKNLWIINQYINTSSESGSSRHYYLSKYLLGLNWKVTLITGSIDHNTNKQRLNKSISLKKEVLDEIRMIWIKVKKRSLNNNFIRGLSMVEFFLKIIFLIPLKRTGKPDMVIGSSPNLLAALAAYFISLFYKCPFILEVRDLWPESLITLKAFKKDGLFHLFFDLIHKFLIKKSNKVIVLMEGGINFYAAMGLDKKKLFYLPNGVDMENKFYKNYDTKLINKKPVEIFYLGFIGHANGIEILIKVYKELQSRGLGQNDLILRIYGDGPLKEKMKKLVFNLHLDNIFFYQPIPKNQIIDISNSADFFIFSMLDLPAIYNYGISFNKIFEYMSLSKPIIYNSYGKFNPLDLSDSAIKSKSNHPKDFADTIQYALNLSRREREDLTKRSFQYVSENHSYESLAINLNNFLMGE